MGLTDTMKKNQDAPNCSVCGRFVVDCSAQAVACVCSTCVGKQAWQDIEEGHQCEGRGCDKTIAAGLTLCPKCKRKAEKAELSNKLKKRGKK